MTFQYNTAVQTKYVSYQAERDARRVLLIMTSHTYRAQAFQDAAEQLGIDVVQVVDMPRPLADRWDVTLGLDFNDLESAVDSIRAFATQRNVDAIIAVDDSGSLLAARASEALGLHHNSVTAAEAARDKFRMRQLLLQAGVPSPQFQRFSTSDDLREIAAQVPYPCVVKPLTLSGSRGVIRANNVDELVAAVNRLESILSKIAPGPFPFLVEKYVSGFEVALEGLLNDGQLIILALFDKPDPLDGPFFEETIYVTPSRLPDDKQQTIGDCTAAACSALGLRTGPIHAELRLNENGPWILEVAGRSIGGLCSQTLRFGEEVSLEELILRQACGMEIQSTERERSARGVMMIPIPEAGILKEIKGCTEAEAVPLIERIEITAKINYPLVPLPEGESYLGFIFARGETPAAVEAALRRAHDRLHFKIAPYMPLTPLQP